MPTFKNQENQTHVLHPEGDYHFTVTGLETGIQSGSGKTVGSPFWELKLAIDKGGVVYEKLIDHPTCDWKIDTFLKCTNAAPPVGVAFEFDADAAASAGIHWIDPIGLRGTCRLIVEEYTKQGTTEKRKINRVGTFYTDKPKLPRAPKPETQQPATDPSHVPPPAADPHSDEGLPF